MTATKQEVIADLRGYLARLGGPYRTWYVGITADPRARLFRDHGLDEKADVWVSRECESSEVAREVEELFARVLGADGGPGGGDASTRWVYAYRKSPRTRP